jgi:predicted phosphodiesterase
MALKSEVAREFRSKFPNASTLTLARAIYNKNKSLFKDVEDARYTLRYIEGKTGVSKPKDKTFVIKEHRPKNPFKLPESDSEAKEPFKLPLLCNNILFISDLHIPYHDIPAITAALEYGKKENVNTIFINGDLLDFHKLSRFVNDPRKRNIAEELEAARQFFESLRKVFPKASIYYLKGNHCMRLELYLRVKAPELLDVNEFQLDVLLQLNKYKVTIIDDKQLVKIGKLSVTHGHHVLRGIFAPVNSARGTYLRAKQSTIISHVHKVSSHSETDMDGNVITCWSTGCLCELKPDYSPLVSNYSHGFAHIKVDKEGRYKVYNHQIINGKIY